MDPCSIALERRTILKSIESYDIGTLKRIAYEVRCEEMGIYPDSTYIEETN